jgi:DNA-binding MarR family transcriptional regulator
MQELALESVTDAVLSASRVLVAVAARSLADTTDDVTLPQYRVLVALCARGALGMSELADELRCSPSTATRLCDRLVRKGLASRGHRPENRREVEVDVTATGRRLVARVTGRRREEIARIVARVPDRKRAAMVNALRTFADAAGEAPDQAWTTGWDL